MKQKNKDDGFNYDYSKKMEGFVSSTTNSNIRTNETNQNDLNNGIKPIIKKDPPSAGKNSSAVRITDEEFEFINAYVIHKRLSGNVYFTKKEALTEAIRLLMQNNPTIL